MPRLPHGKTASGPHLVTFWSSQSIFATTILIFPKFLQLYTIFLYPLIYFELDIPIF